MNLNLSAKELCQTWVSGLGVLHFLMLQTVRKAKLMLLQLGHFQLLSRPAPKIVQEKRQRINLSANKID